MSSELISALKADIQYAAPQKLLTRAAGFLAGRRMGAVTAFAIRNFVYLHLPSSSRIGGVTGAWPMMVIV